MILNLFGNLLKGAIILFHLIFIIVMIYTCFILKNIILILIANFNYILYYIFELDINKGTNSYNILNSVSKEELNDLVGEIFLKEK